MKLSALQTEISGRDASSRLYYLNGLNKVSALVLVKLDLEKFQFIGPCDVIFKPRTRAISGTFMRAVANSAEMTSIESGSKKLQKKKKTFNN